MFLVCRGDRDQGHSRSLPWSSDSLCFLLFSLETSSPNSDPVTIWSRLSQITLNWLRFKILWEYFWNIIICLHISEPGPNLRQNKWHFVQGVVALFLAVGWTCKLTDSRIYASCMTCSLNESQRTLSKGMGKTKLCISRCILRHENRCDGRASEKGYPGTKVSTHVESTYIRGKKVLWEAHLPWPLLTRPSKHRSTYVTCKVWWNKNPATAARRRWYQRYLLLFICPDWMGS